jgi:hypothetical protein
MGVREKLNNNPALVGGVVVVVVILALIITYVRMPKQTKVEIPDSAFFTDDEGLTYFEDDSDKIVPYERNGKTVYRAWVYRCGSDKPFVGVIGRYTAAGRELLEENKTKPKKDQEPNLHFTLENMHMEIRKVSADQKRWTINDALEGARLRESVMCPSGEPAKPVEP